MLSRISHITMAVAIVFSLAIARNLFSEEDCTRRQWVTFPPTLTTEGDTVGPFEHVMIGMVEGNLTLLALPQPEGPQAEAPLVTIATYDAFTNLWSYDYAEKEGTSDAVLFAPYDITLPTHIECVPLSLNMQSRLRLGIKPTKPGR